jgi:hypothetical protein
VLEAVDAEGSDNDGFMVYSDPVNKVKSIIYALIVDEELITVEDTGYILESCKLPEVRETISIFFRGITTSRQI